MTVTVTRNLEIWQAKQNEKGKYRRWLMTQILDSNLGVAIFDL